METWNNGMPEGLTTAGAQKLLEKYGRNELTPQKKESFFKKALHVMAEPMFLLDDRLGDLLHFRRATGWCSDAPVCHLHDYH